MAWRALLSICHVCLSEQHTASLATVLFALEGVRLAPKLVGAQRQTEFT